ncbi:MAG: NUDIX hydrolase [Candidatus Eremiobacteraeota bacterium]|nr:NUDIX hydrolase [Candidatus Eremiobacteraeota bacterium]
MKDSAWRIVASSFVVDDPYLRLRKDSLDLPNGAHVDDYYVRESRGFCIIFALTVDDEIVLVEQYKHGAGRSLLELPAGAIDPHESPLQTAQRELLEETGYSGDLEPMGSFVTEPTHSDAVAHLFFARDARRVGDQQLDATEEIAVSLVPRNGLLDLVRSGRIDSMPHVASIYFVLDALHRRTQEHRP